MVSILSGFIGSPLVLGQNYLHINSGSQNVFSSPGGRPCAFSALKFAEEHSKVAGSRKKGTSFLEVADERKYNCLNDNPVFSPTVKIKVDSPSLNSRRCSLVPRSRLPCGSRRNSCIPSLRSASNCEDPNKLLDNEQEKQEVRLTKMIGRGGFGRVYLGMLNKNRVAVKKLHDQTKNVKAKAESFKAELKAKSLEHPNIVRVIRTSDDTDCDKGYIVMEYVSDCNVQQLLDDQSQRFHPERRISYALDIARALEFIHANCLVHLDVKPANILVTPYDSCKLGDFGCCQVIENGTGRVSPTQRSYLTGTFAYRAPELLRGEAPSTKADVYSLAITLWQLASRNTPYSGLDQHVVIFGVVANNLRPSMCHNVEQVVASDSIVDEFYKDVYEQCWNSDQDKRLPASTLVNLFSYCWKNMIDLCP